MSAPPRYLAARDMVVDLFAGGGGASTGLEAATGRAVSVAINHSPVALAVHAANHPATTHLVTDVFDVDPAEATRGRKVSALWASPDCTHFSIAKGGKPRSKGIRSLAEVVVQWAAAVRPAVIFTENVREFLTWGPLYSKGAKDPGTGLDLEGHPIPERAGELFARWRVRLELLGYQVEWRVLDASEYGAPTRRRRLFVVARCDGQPIRWPEATHGPGRLPYRTAAECIDWSIPCPSIFGRKKPLAPATLRRIAAGIVRYVLEAAQPFVVTIDHQSSARTDASVEAPLSTVTTKARHVVVAPSIVKVNHGGERSAEAIDRPLTTVTATQRGHALVAPTLIQTGYGERQGQRPRSLDLHEPLGTVVAGGSKHALVAAFLAKHYGGHTTPGQPLSEPASTITTQDHHALVTASLEGAVDHRVQVGAFLAAYYGSGSGLVGHALTGPVPTVTTRDRFALVTVEGVPYCITDIGMRMLEPHELLRAQFGRFAEGYDMTAAKTKAAQVRLIGNSVCPDVAEALVRANVAGAAREAA